MNNFVQNNYAGQRQQRGAVWLTSHGSNEIQSVSVGVNPPEGNSNNPYKQIVEGTVLARRDDLQLHYPCAADTAQANVASANAVVVADVFQFQVGQYVELPLTTGAARFRQITAIDYATSTLTLDGGAFSLTAGDALLVDGGRTVTTVATTASAPGASTTDIVVADASGFAVGDLVSIGSALLTFSAELTYDAGVLALVDISVGGNEYLFEHAQATDAATSVAALRDQINAVLPASTVLASVSGDTLVLTSEGPDFTASFGFGTGRDTGVWDRLSSDTTETLITAINTGTDTITVEGDIAVTAGDLFVSESDGQYKITTKTVTIDEYEYTPQNVLIPYRPIGRVKEILVVGLVPAAKTELSGRIIFDQRTIA